MNRPRSKALAVAHRIRATLPARVALPVDFLRVHGRLPNTRNPKTFSEKIQRRKLFEQDDRFSILSDKILVKDFVARSLGSSWVIPTIWSGKELPEQPVSEDPIIVKANFGSGMNTFIRSEEDWINARAMSQRWMSSPWKTFLNEPWYDLIDRNLLVEPILGEDLMDYKFFVFHGECKLIQIDTGRFFEHKRCFYSTSWERVPIRLKYAVEHTPIARPKHLKEMIYSAERLGADFDFVRVDLYETPHGPRFGEMTFSPGSGYERFTPRSYDAYLGSLW